MTARRAIRWVTFLCLIVLSACLPSPTLPEPNPAPATSLATGPAPANSTPAPSPAPSIATPGPLNLGVWMSDEFALAPAASGGDVLTTTIAAFQSAFPDIHVSITPKKAYGKGGLLDLLVATESALPQAAPDVVTLDLRDVPQLARDGRVQPFDARFAPATLNDMFPFARGAGLLEGRLYAAPFTADALHVVYDNTLFKSAPLTWNDVQAVGAKYALPAGGDNLLASDSLLAQYVALGGKFSDPSGKPALDRTPLRTALEFYRNGVTQGTIISNVLSLKSADDAWLLFTSGKATIADVSAHTYLRARGTAKNAAYGAVPTREGNLTTIARSWGFAIVTHDATRHAAAERFIEWMLSAENNAAWNRASDRLPVRRSAIILWSNDTAYRDFINQLLNSAVNRPPTTNGNTLDSVLQTALTDVLLNNLSAADSADKAIAALGR